MFAYLCVLLAEYLTPASTAPRPMHNYYNTDTYDGGYLNVGRNRGPEAPLLPPPPSRPTAPPALPTAAAVENPDYFNTSGLPAAPSASGPSSSSSGVRVPSTTTSLPKQQQNAATFAAVNPYYMDRNEPSNDSKDTELRPLLNGGSSTSSAATGRRVGSREASPKPVNTVIRAPLAGADGETAIWASSYTFFLQHLTFHSAYWLVINNSLIAFHISIIIITSSSIMAIFRPSLYFLMHVNYSVFFRSRSVCFFFAADWRVFAIILVNWCDSSVNEIWRLFTGLVIASDPSYNPQFHFIFKLFIHIHIVEPPLPPFIYSNRIEFSRCADQVHFYLFLMYTPNQSLLFTVKYCLLNPSRDYIFQLQNFTIFLNNRY